MSYWYIVPVLGTSAFLQSTLVPLLAIGGWKIDLPLLVVVSWGLLAVPGEAGLWGFIAGIFLDLFSGLPFGTQTLALTSIGLLMGLTQTTIFTTNVILPPAAIFIATVAYDVLILAIISTVGTPVQWNDYMIYRILPTAILNTFVLPLVYFPLLRLQRRVYPQIEW
jgi:rod shape-determining protein MreD